jgi:hypothetical protein
MPSKLGQDLSDSSRPSATSSARIEPPEFLDPGDRFVSPVLEQRQDPAGAEHPRDLGQCSVGLEPAERLGDRDRVGAGALQRDLLRPPGERGHLGHGAGQLVPKLGVRLDRGDDPVAFGDELTRQLAGPRCDLDDLERCRPELPADRIQRVAGTPPLVGTRHGAKAARRRLAVRTLDETHQSHSNRRRCGSKPSVAHQHDAIELDECGYHGDLGAPMGGVEAREAVERRVFGRRVEGLP